MDYYQNQPKEFEEIVVDIRRVSKKTKGGNTMRFSSLVVVGNKNGKVGVALGKAPDVRSSIQKAVEKAKRNMIEINLNGKTIPYSIYHKYSAAKILLKPAPPGSGVIAGGTIRTVLEAAGVKDAVGKIMGTNNKITNVYATIDALKAINEIRQSKVNKSNSKKVKSAKPKTPVKKAK